MHKRPRKVPQCRADRMEYARRFRALLADLGLTYPDAAQLLHVSLRTLHNWAAGTHAVPYAVTKLLRMLRFLELPGKAWAGWHFTRGCLVTPEGRTIAAHESSWWSLMVRRSESFGKLYAQQTTAATVGRSEAADVAQGLAKGIAQPQNPGYSESCLSHLTAPAAPQPSSIPYGNYGDNNSITGPSWGQSDTIMAPWPLISDLPPKSIPLPVPTANGSESPSIPLSASPLTPIYNGPESTTIRDSLSPLPVLQAPQRLPLSALPALPLRQRKSRSSRLQGLPRQILSRSSKRTPAKPIEPDWPTGIAGTQPANRPIGGVV